MVTLGASNQTVLMAALFLENRSMRIKLSNCYSKARPMPGGAPQGTKTGNLLFCIAVSSLDNNKSRPRPSTPDPRADEDLYGLADLHELPSSPLGGTQ